MSKEITVPEYLAAVEAVRIFEDQVKASLTVEGFIDWYLKHENLYNGPSQMVRALSILKDEENVLFNVSGKALKRFAGFGSSYGRSRFDIIRTIYYEKVIEDIRNDITR